jgi:phosphate transport system substrate-binding protein
MKSLRNTFLLSLSLGLISLATTAVSTSANAAETKLITGAGASFPYPIYSKWFSMYNKENPNVEINYQSIGSGGGIKQLTAKTVDFGASDAPMTEEELKAAPAAVVHIPTVMGAVVLTYNLPTVKAAVKLTPSTLADIFMGKIKKWNDPQLVAINKGLTLPDQDIVVAYRSDSSGTTAIFTDYLAKVSSAWKTDVGAGKAVKWMVGVGGKGNEGVTGFIKNTPGAIGYVELTYADSQKLPVVELQNKAGKFVKPSIQTVSNAAAGSIKNIPDDFRVSITDADGAASYPISAFTYLLVYKDMTADKGTDIVKFLGWAMAKGQAEASALSYAPLPGPVLAKVKAKIKTLSITK